MGFHSAGEARPQGHLQKLGKLPVALGNFAQELVEYCPAFPKGPMITLPLPS